MASQQLIEAIRTIRKECVIKDEPLKAYKLLKHFNFPELSEEEKNSYGMVRHVYDPEELRKAYQDVPCEDSELIEPEDLVLHAEYKYPRYAWILEEMVKEQAASMLDLGCYMGSVVTTAASRGIYGTGVDFTPVIINKAKARAKKFGLEDKCEFYIQDVTTFRKKADIVMSFEVLEHVIDPKAYLALMAANANKWAYVSTPNGPFMNGKGNVDMGWEWDGNGVRGHIRVFTKES